MTPLSAPHRPAPPPGDLSRDHHLLLVAALASGERARQAWVAWRAEVDPFDDPIDPGTWQLLPRLVPNLRRLGVADPVLGRLRGLARRAWYTGQTRLQAVRQLGERLAIDGQPALLLAGQMPTGEHSTIAGGGSDWAALHIPRPVDGPLPSPLAAAGWHARPAIAPHQWPAVWRRFSRWPFHHPAGHTVYVHTHILDTRPGEATDRVIRRRARPFGPPEGGLAIPDRLDQALIACDRLRVPDGTPLATRLFETWRALNPTPNPLDPTALAERARELGLSAAIDSARAALDRILTDPWPGPAPKTALTGFGARRRRLAAIWGWQRERAWHRGEVLAGWRAGIDTLWVLRLMGAYPGWWALARRLGGPPAGEGR